MSFDPKSALLGGVCIGVSALWGFFLEGRVTGISGELYESICLKCRSIFFISGLVFGGFALRNTPLNPVLTDPLAHLSKSRITIGGYLIGIGASLANGCTSGHGVCGLVRLSRRSFVAVVSFMITSILTGSITGSVRHLPLVPPLDANRVRCKLRSVTATIICFSILPFPLARVSMLATGYGWGIVAEVFKNSLHFCRGALFATGLVISGMVHPAKTLGFMNIFKKWDPSMAFVFLSALPLSFIGYSSIACGRGPVLGGPMENYLKELDYQLVCGSILFGLGWGLTGLCPGPAITYVGAQPRSRASRLAVVSIILGLVVGKSISWRDMTLHEHEDTGFLSPVDMFSNPSCS